MSSEPTASDPDGRPVGVDAASVHAVDVDAADVEAEDVEAADVDAADVDAVDVYWRPGCGYCARLLRVFEQAEVTLRLHNIWEDEAARRFVQEHNGGNETVPTVAVGDQVETNPSPRPFVEQLSRDHPGLVGAELRPSRLRWPRLGG